MKHQLLLTALVAFAVSCVSPKHNNKEMNTERLTYFSFDHHNSMAQNGEKYNISTTNEGKIHIIIDEGLPGKKEFYLDDTSIFDDLLVFVKTYKMDKYEAVYKPEIEAYDGDSWSLYYRYDTKRSVSSGGYMAWPDNYREMRQALSKYFQKWREAPQMDVKSETLQ